MINNRRKSDVTAKDIHASDTSRTYDKLLNAPAKFPVKAFAKATQFSVKVSDVFLKRNYPSISNISWRMPEEKLIHVNNIDLSYLHWPGSGSPVILLHGLNSVAWSWARVASILSEKHEVFAINLRGHGKSSVPEEGYLLENTSKDLLEFLNSLSIEKADIAGESWGGKVAMHFAATSPERIKSITLADPVLPQGMNPLLTKFPSIIMSALLLERGSFSSIEELTKKAEGIVYLPLGDEIDRRSWQGRFCRTKTGGYKPVLPDKQHAQIIEKAILADISPVVQGLTTPTLLLVPTMSISFWPGEVRNISQLFTNISIEHIDGDHTFVSANPLVAANKLLSFISSNQ